MPIFLTFLNTRIWYRAYNQAVAPGITRPLHAPAVCEHFVLSCTTIFCCFSEQISEFTQSQLLKFSNTFWFDNGLKPCVPPQGKCEIYTNISVGHNYFGLFHWLIQFWRPKIDKHLINPSYFTSFETICIAVVIYCHIKLYSANELLLSGSPWRFKSSYLLTFNLRLFLKMSTKPLSIDSPTTFATVDCTFWLTELATISRYQFASYTIADVALIRLSTNSRRTLFYRSFLSSTNLQPTLQFCLTSELTAWSYKTKCSGNIT